MKDCKIFYSWQSDLPNSSNRGFIEKALRDAAKLICNDESIEVEPVVDRDTSGVPGSPDIASTIFAKIEQARIFVCDISIINLESKSRLTPNPNVLIELGYAVKSLGSERIIMVMNTEFGTPENLPFDLRMRRVITYSTSQVSQEKAAERKQLERKLYAALTTIFTEQDVGILGEVIQPTPISELARVAVENAQPNQEAMIRKFMNNLVEQLDSIAPDLGEEISDQTIVDAIAQTIEIGVEFALLAEAVALMNASSAAMFIYKGFEGIISRYDTPVGFTGRLSRWAFDFYKFIGYEFFVTLFSFLIREERWGIITELLEEDLYIDNLYGVNKATTVPFTYICSHLESLEARKRRLQLNGISTHADLLNERHTQGNLAEVVPMQQFMNADCFLMLRVELQTSKINSYSWWGAWSLIYIKQPPRYLIEAYRIKNAQKLLLPLQMSSVEMLRSRMIEITPKLSQASRHSISFMLRRHPLGDFDPQSIGSRS